jgi:hypothetical protein
VVGLYGDSDPRNSGISIPSLLSARAVALVLMMAAQAAVVSDPLAALAPVRLLNGRSAMRANRLLAIRAPQDKPALWEQLTSQHYTGTDMRGGCHVALEGLCLPALGL